ncbi:site-specific integrase [Azospirillum sp. RWY-5-1]|uniref:Site-specific integrase n=1 Tax=Azospirillum oleiclasticum TaxID=2735135 RepID=A0ABX2TC41_9PROT|nr:site-specific integrase [Azospirillum oleiclasticum]NYZ13558.1 site-specific integrase [Azospirillum oleiclasticum]NYZ20718.1 site-specific integrase [Azospirillum oleiclasticum]
MGRPGRRTRRAPGLRWEDVDLEQGLLRIRDGKAGARVHPVGSTTVAFLSERPRTSPWFLPAASDPEEPLSASTLEHAWTRIRARAGLPDVRLHDLRHTVGTYVGQAGANAFLVRDKLGHKTLAMTGRYVNRDARPLRDLSDRVESRVMGALKAGADQAAEEAIAAFGDNVVALPKRRGRRPAGRV